MEKDVLESMPAAQRTSYEVSRRKALGMVDEVGPGRRCGRCARRGSGNQIGP